MVPPISLSRPTRVFSRLPYTGEDKTLPAVCCDLSRTASIAPAHPLPKNLLSDSSNPGYRAKFVLDSLSDRVPTAQRKEPAINSSADYQFNGSSPKSKTRNVFYALQTAPSRNISEGAVTATNLLSPGSTGVKRPNTNEAHAAATKKMKLNHSDSDVSLVSTLITENQKLKDANDILRKKLMTFQMIMREKESYNLAMKKVQEMEVRNSLNVV